MNKRRFMALLIAAVPGLALAQKKRQKFYITGLSHENLGDCKIPPIVAYGADRVDALLHCCEGGGLTVWTQEEWDSMQARIGKEFDETCKALLKEERRKEKR